jgi:hypothetical protein
MKETMYSGIDTECGGPRMIWVRDDRMATTTDIGDGDPWRNSKHPRTQHFGDYFHIPHDPSRFTDLTLVWERDV